MSSRNRQRITRLWVLALLAPVTVQADAWTTPRGKLWAKASWFRQSTDEWYTGSAQPILSDNTLGERPAGSRQPYRFDDDTRIDPPSESGFSDLRVMATGGCSAAHSCSR